MRGRLFQGEPTEIEVGDSAWQRGSTWESGAKRSSELGVLNHSIHIYISIMNYDITLFFLSFLYLSCGGAKFIRYVMGTFRTGQQLHYICPGFVQAKFVHILNAMSICLAPKMRDS